MQSPPQKCRIVKEAYRVLKSGGRYGIHELCLVPDGLNESKKEEIQRALSGAIHVGARPLTSSEWRQLLESEGFEVKAEATAPMHLLEPKRLVQDEGLGARCASQETFCAKPRPGEGCWLCARCSDVTGITLKPSRSLVSSLGKERDELQGEVSS